MLLLTLAVHQALILFGLAVCLLSASVSLVFIVLYVIRLFCYILCFTSWWAEPDGIGPWPQQSLKHIAWWL